MEKILPVPIRATIAANVAPAMALPGADKGAVLANLKEGLGLVAPVEGSFWKRVGNCTGSLTPEDKIWLLVDLVPVFGAQGAGALDRAAAFPEVLEATVALVAEALPTRKPGDVQLLAAELALSDFLFLEEGAAAGAGAVEAAAEFLAWVRGLTPKSLEAVLEERKAFTASAKAMAAAKKKAEEEAEKQSKK